MCNADVAIVTHYWHRGTMRPIADFDNPQKCCNFEGVLHWSEQHAVQDDMEKWRTIKRPEDGVIFYLGLLQICTCRKRVMSGPTQFDRVNLAHPLISLHS